MVFLLSEVVSAATQSKSQSSLGHPAERVGSRSRSLSARHTRSFSRALIAREFSGFFPAFFGWLPSRSGARASSTRGFATPRHRIPGHVSGIRGYRVRSVQFRVCGNVVPQPVSARAPHDDRSTRDTIRSREVMDGTTLLRDSR
jgi:hypothetical protein